MISVCHYVAFLLRRVKVKMCLKRYMYVHVVMRYHSCYLILAILGIGFGNGLHVAWLPMLSGLLSHSSGT